MVGEGQVAGVGLAILDLRRAAIGLPLGLRFGDALRVLVDTDDAADSGIVAQQQARRVAAATADIQNQVAWLRVEQAEIEAPLGDDVIQRRVEEFLLGHRLPQWCWVGHCIVAGTEQVSNRAGLAIIRRVNAD